MLRCLSSRQRRVFEEARTGPDCVERIGLPARAALPPRPADLEHVLAVIGMPGR
jgi:hypothetical protein